MFNNFFIYSVYYPTLIFFCYPTHLDSRFSPCIHYLLILFLSDTLPKTKFSYNTYLNTFNFFFNNPEYLLTHTRPSVPKVASDRIV